MTYLTSLVHAYVCTNIHTTQRLAIVASLRHRTKLSLVLFCPLLVLIMLFATLVSFSRDSVTASSDALNHVYPDVTLTGGAGGKGE